MDGRVFFNDFTEERVSGAGNYSAISLLLKIDEMEKAGG